MTGFTPLAESLTTLDAEGVEKVRVSGPSRAQLHVNLRPDVILQRYFFQYRVNE